MYDKPQVVADRPRFTPEKIAGIEENWRQELESLLAVDEGVAQDRRHAAPDAASSRTR